MGVVLQNSIAAWWPELILSAAALLAALAGAWTRRAQPALGIAVLAVAAAAGALSKSPVPPATDVFFGFILCDSFSLMFRWFALAVTFLVLLMAAGSTKDVRTDCRGEYFSLILFVCVGLMLMAEASHLLMAYLAMEMVSLSSYLLVGLVDSRRSAEAGLKYLLFGALASAMMLFGMSLLFGLTGQLSFPAISLAAYGLIGITSRAATLAIVLMLVGLAFKISMVPFHQWTPDAYEGAPTPVAALLSVGPKAAALALLMRLTAALSPFWSTLVPLLLVLTAATMTVGNLIALVQSNIKRLLAYSTIGQVGYMLLAFTASTTESREALFVYLAAYLFMNLGAFACVTAVAAETGSESIEAFRGLARRSPALAAATAVFFLSLAGLPPLFGFIGKFLIFKAALENGLVWLVIVAAVNSAIALYYYVIVIRRMYFDASLGQSSPVPVGFSLKLAIVACVVATLALGLYPAPVLDWVRGSLVLNLL